jgi:uncharacterized membrane protein YgcG
MQNLSLQ